MPRDSKVYLEDILEAVRRIRSYTAGLSRPGFLNDKKTAAVSNRRRGGVGTQRLLSRAPGGRPEISPRVASRARAANSLACSSQASRSAGVSRSQAPRCSSACAAQPSRRTSLFIALTLQG